MATETKSPVKFVPASSSLDLPAHPAVWFFRAIQNRTVLIEDLSRLSDRYLAEHAHLVKNSLESTVFSYLVDVSTKSWPLLNYFDLMVTEVVIASVLDSSRADCASRTFDRMADQEGRFFEFINPDRNEDLWDAPALPARLRYCLNLSTWLGSGLRPDDRRKEAIEMLIPDVHWLTPLEQEARQILLPLASTNPSYIILQIRGQVPSKKLAKLQRKILQSLVEIGPEYVF